MKQYLNRDWLRSMYEDKSLSQLSIAKLCGVDQSTIHKYLIRFNIPCRKFCGRSGIHCSRWNGGRYLSTQGYIHILLPSHPRAGRSRGYVPEQVLTAENALGRNLSKDEAVHHINGIKTDNRPENLYLFQNEAEHQRYHQKLRKGSCEPIIESNLVVK